MRIKRFIKKNYRYLIPILFVIILGLALIIYFYEYKNNRYVKIENINVYQYFANTKFEYELDISRNNKNLITSIDSGNYNVNFDSTPIYVTDSSKVIFPTDMNIVIPIKNFSQYRSIAYLELELKNDLVYLNTNKFNRALDYFFLYDGDDLYFFVDEVTIQVNGDEINLSKFSYLKLKYQNTLEYYDKENDNYYQIDLNKDDVIVTNDYLNLNVSTDKVDYFGQPYLLTTNLGYLSTIDKMNKKSN